MQTWPDPQPRNLPFKIFRTLYNANRNHFRTATGFGTLLTEIREPWSEQTAKEVLHHAHKLEPCHHVPMMALSELYGRRLNGVRSSAVDKHGVGFETNAKRATHYLKKLRNALNGHCSPKQSISDYVRACVEMQITVTSSMIMHNKAGFHFAHNRSAEAKECMEVCDCSMTVVLRAACGIGCC